MKGCHQEWGRKGAEPTEIETPHVAIPLTHPLPEHTPFLHHNLNWPSGPHSAEERRSRWDHTDQREASKLYSASILLDFTGGAMQKFLI